MLRSLWTAASGMISQQVNVDTIANNLSNINTTGYKTERTEFQSLLYQTIQKKSTDSEGDAKPVGVQVGLGVRSSAITSQFTQGALNETGGAFDLAIEGLGFFQVQKPDGSIAYTRNGSLKMSTSGDGLTLCTSEGYPILDINGEAITIPATYNSSLIAIDTSGRLCYPNEKNNYEPIGIQIGLVQFNNPAGLEKSGGSLFNATASSGEARFETMDDSLTVSKIHQGYIEASNVQAVDEMVNMIVAQRAYEMNSKAITASDEMLQQANNLRQ